MMKSAFVLALLLAPGGHGEAADSAFLPPIVDYTIEATLDERTDVLTGRARLRYTNRSRSQLDTLFFHQHLNAFRPNSAWARHEAGEGRLRFQALGSEEHAFERLTSASVDGRAIRPFYPGGRDSTVMALPLPAPIRPGETAEVLLDWEARLSTTPRRQGRQGRHYDWAHWYPRIAVFNADGWQYQTLLPQGEFWGEFASYDVTLEVAGDQVIASTGIPVSGDPGWDGARAAGEIHYARDAYPPREHQKLGLLQSAAPEGSKRVRWRADAVIHFAWSADPDFIYEGGLWRTLPVHVLYRPAAAGEWGNGIALERTLRALDWGYHVFGAYVYPQVTNAHRIERGGTEFPMLLMNGSASEGLIVHEILHQYAHAILANNEWAEGWLDEGLTSFLGSWYFEARGVEGVWDRSLAAARERERRGLTQPVALPGAAFRDFAMYQAMTYTKAELVFRMLRGLVGEDTMLQILRRYYETNKLTHVDEAAFRHTVNSVAGESFDWFFDQWLHTTDRLDYGIADAVARRTTDGSWRTTVTVDRAGDAWMPVELRVGAEVLRLDSRERRQTVEVVTRERPSEVVLDPRDLLLDYDRTNNRRAVQ
jgi:hypothetical protein